jgi:hypothetical protein
MAYISTEEVKAIRNELKKQLPEYKFSVRRLHHSKVSVSFTSGKAFAPFPSTNWEGETEFTDPGETGYYQFNPYAIHSYGENTDLLKKVQKIIKTAPATVGGKGWYDNSDIYTDYFDTAYYFSIDLGQWDKPYQVKQ